MGRPSLQITVWRWWIISSRRRCNAQDLGGRSFRCSVGSCCRAGAEHFYGQGFVRAALLRLPCAGTRQNRAAPKRSVRKGGGFGAVLQLFRRAEKGAHYLERRVT